MSARDADDATNIHQFLQEAASGSAADIPHLLEWVAGPRTAAGYLSN